MRLILVSLAAACLAPLAHAEPGMAGVVYGPSVTRGETEIEARYGRLQGGPENGEWIAIAEIGHAFTDFWRPALLVEIERAPGQGPIVEAVAIENVFDFTGTRDWPVHLGAYAEYEAGLRGNDDKVELKLLAERDRGPVRLRFNLIGERALDDAEPWEFGYAAQARFALNDDFALGIEGFGEAGTEHAAGGLDDHAHYWGPFAEFEAFETQRGELEIQIGYLAGVADAEGDGQWRVRFEWEIAPRR